MPEDGGPAQTNEQKFIFFFWTEKASLQSDDFIVITVTSFCKYRTHRLSTKLEAC